MSNTVIHNRDDDRLPSLEALRPDLELLRWLTRGSLKQNLLRAIRLWVWLRLLYGGNQSLPDAFTFADCRHLFFSASHPKGEQIPERHDPDCLCARPTREWLFGTETGLSETEWQQDLQQYEKLPKRDLQKLLDKRLFAVTRRSLSADLQELAKLGWLEYSEQDRRYRRVAQFPDYPVAKPLERLTTAPVVDSLQFLQPDLGAIAQNHAANVRGIQRFFLHLDYIIPSDKLDDVDDWQEMLRQVWEQDPIPPLQLIYQSARRQTTFATIVYPVCIYYAQRSVYLCGFNPELEQQWYNFRLDRIQQCYQVDWADAVVPSTLSCCYQKGMLPDPSYVQIELDKAWGFDFYLPLRQMILRFNRNFHDRYIAGTFRHSTFHSIDRSTVTRLIRQHQDPLQHKALMQILELRPKVDRYYQVCYRDGDPNVQHRLRAWRPHVEVLLPWSLRREIAQEVWTELQFYKDEHNVSVSID